MTVRSTNGPSLRPKKGAASSADGEQLVGIRWRKAVPPNGRSIGCTIDPDPLRDAQQFRDGRAPVTSDAVDYSVVKQRVHRSHASILLVRFIHDNHDTGMASQTDRHPDHQPAIRFGRRPYWRGCSHGEIVRGIPAHSRRRRGRTLAGLRRADDREDVDWSHWRTSAVFFVPGRLRWSFEPRLLGQPSQLTELEQCFAAATYQADRGCEPSAVACDPFPSVREQVPKCPICVKVISKHLLGRDPLILHLLEHTS